MTAMVAVCWGLAGLAWAFFGVYNVLHMRKMEREMREHWARMEARMRGTLS